LTAMSKRLFFGLLSPEISVTPPVDEVEVLPDLKELESLLILKLTPGFLKEFAMPATFAKLIDLNSLEDDASLEG